MKCREPGCPFRMHAKGYCMSHYGQLYRNGKIGTAPSEDERIRNQAVRAAEWRERVQACEREIGKLRDIYAKVIGFARRLEVKRELRAAEAELATLRAAPVREPERAACEDHKRRGRVSDERLRALRAQGLSVTEICTRVNMGDKSVRTRLAKLDGAPGGQESALPLGRSVAQECPPGLFPGGRSERAVG